MENTIENKAKFFALYWGQDIMKYYFEDETFHIIQGFMHPNYLKASHLQLNPISQISDEDAIEVASIILNKKINPLQLIRWDWRYSVIVNREKSVQDENVEIEMYVSITYDSCDIKFIWDYKHSKGVGQQERHCPNSVTAYDYLRSKGYAVTYMGLSVEKLVEYGWIKLKTK